MKNWITSTCLLLLLSTSYAQKENKIITEENVVRIIKTLAADDMQGRPADQPVVIEKATQFIEKEFKKIGLKPLKGLAGFRQEFTKERIVAESLDVVINGVQVPSANVILVSEELKVNMTSGFSIKSIPFDSAAKDIEQYFFGKAMVLSRDTSRTMIFVDEKLKANFEQFKGFFKSRFATNRKGLKIFVLGQYSPTSYSVNAIQKKEVIKMANVAGMLPGKKKPDEFVVFSAHYDHIGKLEAVEGDSIANGADDDASGITAVIELARYFKKLKNNGRSLIFVAFTAEEIGGYGSKYFSEHQNPNHIMAMFNIEMIGKPSKFGPNTAWITGFEKSDFGEILQKNLNGTPFQFKPDPYPEQNLFYRSDNATLARMGVPAHSISTDEIDIDKLYHSLNDEFESMNIANIVATIRAIALSAKGIVDGSQTPKRIDRSLLR